MNFPAPSEKQARTVWTAASALGVAVILALVALILLGMGWVAKQLSSVLLPLAVAGVIAYLLDPVVDYFQGRGMARSWAIILVFFLAILLQAGMIGTVVPRLIRDTRGLRAEFPEYKDRLRDRINEFLHKPPFNIEAKDIFDRMNPSGILSGFFGEDSNGESALEGAEVSTGPQREETEASLPSTPAESAQPPPTVAPSEPVESGSPFAIDSELLEKGWSLVTRLGELLLDQINKIGSLFGLLAGFALVPVYVFYFLAEKKGIQDSWTDYLPIHESKLKEEIVFVLRSINDSLIVFFRSQVLVAMCVGILLMIGFSIIDLRYGVLLGFIAGILGIVPYLGVMLSIVPAVTISVIQSNGILHPMLTIGIFVLVQMLEGLVISPKIIGDRVGLHPLTVIISIMIGTTLFGGITGGVLAIPLTAALRTLMFRYVWRRYDWEGYLTATVEAEVTLEDDPPPN